MIAAGGSGIVKGPAEADPAAGYGPGSDDVRHAQVVASRCDEVDRSTAAVDEFDGIRVRVGMSRHDHAHGTARMAIYVVCELDNSEFGNFDCDGQIGSSDLAQRVGGQELCPFLRMDFPVRTDGNQFAVAPRNLDHSSVVRCGVELIHPTESASTNISSSQRVESQPRLRKYLAFAPPIGWSRFRR
jgi:hypothetical protein